MRNRMSLASMVLLLALIPAISQGAPRPASLAQLFKQVGGSVVVVRTSGRAVSRESLGKPVSIDGIGSGVLVSADGKVVTAAHVVQTADVVSVEFTGERRVWAKVIASDPAADVALLQLESVPSGFKPVALGDSDKTEIGEEVFVVGAPFGISHTLTVGHVSARRKPNSTFGGIVLAEFLQTDAAINQGNSGGPMFNMQGEVIGIVSHIISRTGGSDGLGFVVTSNMARRLLLDEPSVWSGVEGFLLAGPVARALNLPVSAGAGLLVQRVAAGSPGERLGVRGGSLPAMVGDEEVILGGDVILAVDGIALGSPNAYETIRRHMAAARAGGGTIRVTVLRDGEITELSGTASH
jgi:serine protease Do